ncbi:MAG: IS21 family transposase [Candidatus Riflebacteria bacterium]|nr:IS21 family transposase [Candidatus Riflebacteria bacterium]
MMLVRELLEHELVILNNEGWSIRSLAQRFGMSRNTIREILRKHKNERNNGHDQLKKIICRESKLDDFKEEIKKLSEKFPSITGQRMFEELRELGYQGGITILRDYLSKLEKPYIEPVIRFETEPGQQGQMDWSPYAINFKEGGKAIVQCFSYILGYSRRHFIDFTTKHDFYTLIQKHQAAFEYFQGVVKECLYDNEKTIVLRWENGKPVFNPKFISFITHYNCRPIACRPRSPRTKGKIEAPFKYIEKNLICGREFINLADLKDKAKWWLREKSDLHIHDTTKRPPIELFTEIERQTLMPLPIHPYDSSEVKLLVGRPESFIYFETNGYSIPSFAIGDILSVKATENEILIYNSELTLLARHERLAAGLAGKQENPDHRQSKKEKYGLEPVRERFIALGEAAEEFLAGLIKKHPSSCGSHVRLILSYKENYLNEDIHMVLKHALQYQAFDAKAIQRILEVKAIPRTLESMRNERAFCELEKTIPKIEQRPLGEYNKAFGKENTDERNSNSDSGEN